jgi:excinuclease UvrABC nuclease subunit
MQLELFDNTRQRYFFEIYPKGATFPHEAGVYVFTKRNSNRKHDILYIGETESFKYRLGSGHEKWRSATRMGLTHICILETANRVFIQNRLIEAHNPPLNER